jgi:outer membrane protein OmpA-like peptidoglycan-associated protein
MKNTLLIILSLISIIGFSQKNLVPNPTFEKIEKKIKDKGEIKVATPWTSPTLAQADLYVAKSKNYNISIPENAYGEEKPMMGSGYAGIVGYSDKNKVPRSYLQVQLTETLEEGKQYCVTYHVSLADLSKYAVNHMGVAITDKAITANNSDVLKFDSYIESRKLTIYETQFYWTPICGVYTAKGGEEYLTIGNFYENIDKYKDIKKVKRPRGFTKPQKYDAYYYVDNVSVILKDEVKKCDCDVTPGMENAETVTKDFSSDKSINTTTLKIINTDGSSMTNVEKDSTAAVNESKDSSISSDGEVDGMVIGFSEGKFDIDASVAKLDRIVAYMKENPEVTLGVTGYIDASESNIDKLDGRRVGAVYKYLVSKGIKKEKIDRSMGGEDSIDEKKKSKNMRVEISVFSDDQE